MNKWIAVGALLAVSLTALPVYGQGGSTLDEMQQRLQALEAEVKALARENQDLRAGQDDQLLETQINTLSERLAAGTTVKSAANPVTLTGEFRYRSGWSLGDNASFDFGGVATGTEIAEDEHDGTWTDARVRLGFQYDFTRDVTAFAELQAHWAFGDGAPSQGGFFDIEGGTPSFDSNEASTSVVLYQGWLEVRNIFGRAELSSRTGRQEIVLGNQFQFGNADWYNGWVFDGTRWDWNSESFRLTAMAFKLGSVDGDFNQVSSFFNSHDDDELYSLYFTLKTIKDHQLDIYWIYVNGHGGAIGEGSGTTFGSLGNPVGNQLGFLGTTSYFHTVGARIGGVFTGIAAGLDWNVEGAYQFGDQKTVLGDDLDVDAFAVEAEVGITFSQNSKFRAFVRFLWAEGPEEDESGYITLYPNRHSNGGFRARYGLFDLIPMSNVLTLQGGLHFDPATQWTLGATVLWATTDEEVVQAIAEGLGSTESFDDDYGWEVDVWGEYRYSENLVFGAGVALLFPDDEGEFLWGVDDDLQLLAYIQARLLF